MMHGLTSPKFIRETVWFHKILRSWTEGCLLFCNRQDMSEDLSVSSVTFRFKIEMENAVSVVALINLGTKFVPRYALEEVGDWNVPANN